MLKPGEKLSGTYGGPVTVGKQLGAGRQGSVFEGRNAENIPVAVKWYFPDHQDAALRASVGQLVEQKAPSHHFLWPDDIVTRGTEFGYVMRLRPSDYVDLSAILTRKAGVTFRELLQAATQIVAAFKALQATGLFYCDISHENLFMRPSTGDILICDNDNVGSSRSRPKVLGTPRFMAPEIVRGEKNPSALTDSFSMAVLLFLVLLNHHPLEGKEDACIHVFDHAAMRRLYGTNPIFIFDPARENNRPVPGLHDNALAFWPLYPQPLRDIFTRAFTDGLAKPGLRPSFGEWQMALAAAEDALVVCQCGKQNFSDLARRSLSCWSCRQEVQLPPRLIIEGKRSVLLAPGTRLLARHISSNARADPADNPVAEVVRHPTNDGLGLKNLGPGQWFAQVPGKPLRSIEPDSSIALKAGTTISFGDVSGMVDT